MLLYKSARTQLITLGRENLIMDVLISVPRIIHSTFGKRYSEVSCHWIYNDKIFRLKQHDINVILSKENKWYDNIGCNTKDKVTLCDVRLMKIYNGGCFSKEELWNITKCPVDITKIQSKNEVLQTEAGVVVCNKGEKVTKFKIHLAF